MKTKQLNNPKLQTLQFGPTQNIFGGDYKNILINWCDSEDYVIQTHKNAEQGVVRPEDSVACIEEYQRHIIRKGYKLHEQNFGRTRDIYL